MIKLKTHGVFLDNLHPLVWAALPKIEIIFDYLEKDVIILSARDGNHEVNSLHYEGRALDLRSKHLRKAQKQTVLTQLQATLGKDWTITLEEHFHLQLN